MTLSNAQLMDEIFERISKNTNDNSDAIDELTALSERSGATFSGRVYTLSAAPLAAEGMNTFAFAFISDGRKPGEGSGNGSGVFAMYNPDTDSWLRTSDYTAVTT